MKAKQPSISPFGILLLVCLAMTVSATSCTSCKNGSSPSNEQKSPSPTPTPISAKAKQIEAVILRGDPVNETELVGLLSEELRILRNVVFARHGRQYERPGLGDYFYNCDWYKPNSSYSSEDSTSNWQVILSANDKKNMETILRMEKPPQPSSSQPTLTETPRDNTCIQLYEIYERTYNYGRSHSLDQCILQTSKAIAAFEQVTGTTMPEKARTVLTAGCLDGDLGLPRRSYSVIEREACQSVTTASSADSASDAQSIFNQAVESARRRCKSRVGQEAKLSCFRCAQSCIQEGVDRGAECVYKWEGDKTRIKKCLDASQLQVASCFAGCN